MAGFGGSAGKLKRGDFGKQLLVDRFLVNAENANEWNVSR
jgi:hypothetical protein